MELGCGIRVKPVKHREYLYVWHYEAIGGRRRQVYDYIGPAADPGARRRAAERLEAHVRRAIEQAQHRVRSGRAASVLRP